MTGNIHCSSHAMGAVVCNVDRALLAGLAERCTKHPLVGAIFAAPSSEGIVGRCRVGKAGSALCHGISLGISTTERQCHHG